MAAALRVDSLKSFTITPVLLFVTISFTSPTPLLHTTGIPILSNSPNFVGEEAFLENAGLIKNTDESQKSKYSGTSFLLAFITFISSNKIPAFFAESKTILGSSAVKIRNKASFFSFFNSTKNCIISFVIYQEPTAPK